MWNFALDGGGNPKNPGTNSCGGPGCRPLVTVNSDGSFSPNQECMCMSLAMSRGVIPYALCSLGYGTGIKSYYSEGSRRTLWPTYWRFSHWCTQLGLASRSIRHQAGIKRTAALLTGRYELCVDIRLREPYYNKILRG